MTRPRPLQSCRFLLLSATGPVAIAAVVYSAVPECTTSTPRCPGIRKSLTLTLSYSLAYRALCLFSLSLSFSLSSSHSPHPISSSSSSSSSSLSHAHLDRIFIRTSLRSLFHDSSSCTCSSSSAVGRFFHLSSLIILRLSVSSAPPSINTFQRLAFFTSSSTLSPTSSLYWLFFIYASSSTITPSVHDKATRYVFWMIAFDGVLAENSDTTVYNSSSVRSDRSACTALVKHTYTTLR